MDAWRFLKKKMIEQILNKFSVYEPTTGCNLWVGTYSGKGYGQVKINGIKKYAHRVAWELEKGQIPNGLQVLHHCDTPRCINTLHMFLGTNKDNVNDKVKKGRQQNISLRKLSNCEIKEIRCSFNGCRTLAKKYNVSKSAIQEIKKYKTYKNV